MPHVHSRQRECGQVYRYQGTYRHRRVRIHKPRRITLLLALVLEATVIAFAALTFAILFTGWPPR